MTGESADRWRASSRYWILLLLLAGMTLATFWHVQGCDFVYFDDNIYVFENPHIQSGLTWRSIRWALNADLLFDSPNADYWQPVTFLSRILDFEWYGLYPAGHHRTNMILHVLNVALLFFLLYRMTGDLWPSAAVAGFFAVHPLRVEAVAWVTSRKDVLSTFWAFLTLWAYVRRVESGRAIWNWISVGFFTLGLMSKPMLMMLPILMLLLDFWPLRRTDSTFSQRIFEKWPYVLLAVASGSLSLFLSNPFVFDDIPTRVQALNVPIAYVRYLWMTVQPQPMACYYPYPHYFLDPARVAGAALLLLAITAAALKFVRTRPYLAFGWLWFILGLTPVIGLENGGVADRFAYIPQIGLFIAAAWSASDAASMWPKLRPVLLLAGCGLAAASMLGSAAQIRVWTNSKTLFEHALATTRNNWVAENGVGNVRVLEGRIDEAIHHFTESARIRPTYPKAHFNLGCALEAKGRIDEAIAAYSQALWYSPEYARAHNNLGILMEKRVNHEKAIAHFSQAIGIEPGFAEAHNNLGVAYMRISDLEKAVYHFNAALEIDPNYVEVRRNLEEAQRMQKAPGRLPDTGSIK